MGLKSYPLGASGNALFGGFGPGARVLKDAIKADQLIAGNAGWQLLATELNGTMLQSDGPASFSYDGKIIQVQAHIWAIAYAALALDSANNNQFLAFLLNGSDYKSVVGFVGANALTFFSGEMFAGDTLQLVGQTQQGANTLTGDFCFTASVLPQ
jgi:hypothetical protein